MDLSTLSWKKNYYCSYCYSQSTQESHWPLNWELDFPYGNWDKDWIISMISYKCWTSW